MSDNAERPHHLVSGRARGPVTLRPAPGIPCALFAFEGECHQDPDAICAAGMFKHVLDMCVERSAFMTCEREDFIAPGRIGSTFDVSGILGRPVEPYDMHTSSKAALAAGAIL